MVVFLPLSKNMILVLSLLTFKSHDTLYLFRLLTFVAVFEGIFQKVLHRRRRVTEIVGNEYKLN